MAGRRKAARVPLLRVEEWRGVLLYRFDDAHHVKRVVLGISIKDLERRERERGERRVKGEIVWNFVREVHWRRVRMLALPVHTVMDEHARAVQRRVDPHRAPQ